MTQNNKIEMFIQQNRKICWEAEYQNGEYCIGENALLKFVQKLLKGEHGQNPTQEDIEWAKSAIEKYEVGEQLENKADELAIAYGHWVLKKFFYQLTPQPPSEAKILFQEFQGSEDYKQLVNDYKSSILSMVLIQAYENYIELLVDEIDELASIGRAHGWKSTRVKEGDAQRERISKLKSEQYSLPSIEQIWEYAIILANNACCEISNKYNNDDFVKEAAVATECAKEVRSYLNDLPVALARMEPIPTQIRESSLPTISAEWKRYNDTLLQIFTECESVMCGKDHEQAFKKIMRLADENIRSVEQRPAQQPVGDKVYLIVDEPSNALFGAFDTRDAVERYADNRTWLRVKEIEVIQQPSFVQRKPLTEITDEDAATLANMRYGAPNCFPGEGRRLIKKYFIEREFTEYIKAPDVYRLVKYLLDRGYLIPGLDESPLNDGK